MTSLGEFSDEFSAEPEVFLPKYSQTAILHAAHFRRVVKTFYSIHDSILLKTPKSYTTLPILSDDGAKNTCIGPATRCDVAHLRWGVPKPLRCRKIACDAHQCKFQHVGYFAPNIGISQRFIQAVFSIMIGI